MSKFNNIDSVAIGVDVGGSHISVALVDLESRVMMAESWNRTDVDASEGAKEIIAVWSEAISKTFYSLNLAINHIGIGMPGPFDYENGISYIKGQDKYDALYGLNVKELLAEAMEISPNQILLMNDAACFLLGEVFGGAAKEYNKVLGLTLGTGLGASVFKDHYAFDAELWNTPFKEGIAEDYLSTRWFVKRYFELSGKDIENVKNLADRSSTDIMANKVFREYGENLAFFLNECLGSEDFEAVILGGNIAKAYSIFESSLKANLKPKFKNIIHVATLGEEASIVGASSLWHPDVQLSK